ncbi:MAG TPA: SagB/ThcOx family dehydrogenase [Pseudonocardiaceae bacterium]|nr:SagB/ThcOx family dehydrogenase [Pseudonocardiaceae bacterium]
MKSADTLRSQLLNAFDKLTETDQQAVVKLLANATSAQRVDILQLVHKLINEVATAREKPPTRASLPFKTYPGTAVIPLPHHLCRLSMPLEAVLRSRRSHYHYSPGGLDLMALGSLLTSSYSVNRTAAAYGWSSFPLNVCPSAGGLQPVNIYVLVTRVTEVPRGLYYFHPYELTLQLIRDGDLSDAAGESLLQPEFCTAPVLLVLTCSMDRVLWKYPLRHYRTVHMDTGIVAQSLYLVATALGLNACAIAGFRDHELNNLLNIDGHREFATLVFAVGGGDHLTGKLQP